jgi:hypothetical protein
LMGLSADWILLIVGRTGCLEFPCESIAAIWKLPGEKGDRVCDLHVVYDFILIHVQGSAESCQCKVPGSCQKELFFASCILERCPFMTTVGRGRCVRNSRFKLDPQLSTAERISRTMVVLLPSRTQIQCQQQFNLYVKTLMFYCPGTSYKPNDASMTSATHGTSPHTPDHVAHHLVHQLPPVITKSSPPLEQWREQTHGHIIS